MKKTISAFCKSVALTFSLTATLASCQPIVTPTTDETAKSQPFTLQEKLNLLVRDPEVKGYFQVTDSSIIMFADTANQKEQPAEAEILFKEEDTFLYLCKSLSYDSLERLYLQKGTQPFPYITQSQATITASHSHDHNKPLQGKRIAIDAGHVGGSMETALLEDRYIKMLHQLDTIAFNEGNLTLATAYLLKERLESAGAEVMMTRTQYGHSSFGKTITQWIEEDMEPAITQELEKGMDPFLAKMLREKNTADSGYVYHRFFKYKDFEKRAELINGFQPDLTYIIHYNVDSPNYDKRSSDGVFQPGTENYSMAFVPGSFMRKELSDVRSRIEFLRLLLSDDLQKSVEVADYFERFHKSIAKVHPVAADSELPYLKRGCVYAGKEGVFARNLSLTRMIHSPVVYGESLCQDHKSEAIALSKDSKFIQGKWMPARIEQIADAYYHTTLSFFKN